MTIDPRTPILVGGAQFTQRTAREGKIRESLSPIETLAKVARLAMADAGAGETLAREIDTISVVRFTADSPGDRGRLPKRMFRNPPGSLAKHLGIAPRRGESRKHNILDGAPSGDQPEARTRARFANIADAIQSAARAMNP